MFSVTYNKSYMATSALDYEPSLFCLSPWGWMAKASELYQWQSSELHTSSASGLHLVTSPLVLVYILVARFRVRLPWLWNKTETVRSIRQWRYGIEWVLLKGSYLTLNGRKTLTSNVASKFYYCCHWQLDAAQFEKAYTFVTIIFSLTFLTGVCRRWLLLLIGQILLEFFRNLKHVEKQVQS